MSWRLVSLGAGFGAQTAEKVAGFLRSLGAAAVLDLITARDVARLETTAEFMHRLRTAADGSAAAALPMLASACPGTAVAQSRT